MPTLSAPSQVTGSRKRTTLRSDRVHHPRSIATFSLLHALDSVGPGSTSSAVRVATHPSLLGVPELWPRSTSQSRPTFGPLACSSSPEIRNGPWQSGSSAAASSCRRGSSARRKRPEQPYW
jgi:hypothetical protein